VPAEWTLDDLAARVGAALTAADYPGAPNGRVREVPDRRAIRWYTTIGLLDRPAAMRGRTALYGPRHLAQLVAIKRLQAQGRSLAEIQAELVGASDATLHRVAGLPEGAEAAGTAGAQTALTGTEAAPASPRAFWRQAAVAPGAVPAAPTHAPAPAGPGLAVDAADDVLLTGVPLEGGAVLLLPAAPDPADVAALRAAARPLIDLLTARGLLAHPSRRSPM
jgi:MerR HTH family regulatory protein